MSRGGVPWNALVSRYVSRDLRSPGPKQRAERTRSVQTAGFYRNSGVGRGLRDRAADRGLSRTGGGGGMSRGEVKKSLRLRRAAELTAGLA